MLKNKILKGIFVNVGALNGVISVSGTHFSVSKRTEIFVAEVSLNILK